MNKNILAICSFFLFSFQGMAQNHYQIRLDPIEQGNKAKSCYNIQLAAADGENLSLAGQNYRLYYDAAKLKYASSKSLLSADQYTNFSNKDFQAKESAAGMGNLPFNEKVGLLSLNIDLENAKYEGMILPANGAWKNTCQVCFDNLKEGITSEEGALIWARKELTSGYATAYVEVAEWIDTDKTIPAEGIEYNDRLFLTSLENYQTLEERIDIYPNPVQSELWIEQSADEPSKVEIWSITGQKVIETTIPKGATKERISVEHLASGLYQLRVFKKNQQYTHLVDKVSH